MQSSSDVFHSDGTDVDQQAGRDARIGVGTVTDVLPGPADSPALAQMLAWMFMCSRRSSVLQACGEPVEDALGVTRLWVCSEP